MSVDNTITDTPASHIQILDLSFAYALLTPSEISRLREAPGPNLFKNLVHLAALNQVAQSLSIREQKSEHLERYCLLMRLERLHLIVERRQNPANKSHYGKHLTERGEKLQQEAKQYQTKQDNLLELLLLYSAAVNVLKSLYGKLIAHHRRTADAIVNLISAQFPNAHNNENSQELHELIMVSLQNFNSSQRPVSTITAPEFHGETTDTDTLTHYRFVDAPSFQAELVNTRLERLQEILAANTAITLPELRAQGPALHRLLEQHLETELDLLANLEHYRQTTLSLNTQIGDFLQTDMIPAKQQAELLPDQDSVLLATRRYQRAEQLPAASAPPLSALSDNALAAELAELPTYESAVADDQAPPSYGSIYGRRSRSAATPTPFDHPISSAGNKKDEEALTGEQKDHLRREQRGNIVPLKGFRKRSQ